MIQNHYTLATGGYVVAIQKADASLAGRVKRRRPALLAGLLGSGGIALLAYRRRSLSRDGAAGALLAGTTITGFGGPAWGLALIFFFVSSSLFSHFRAREKAQTAEDKFSKGSQRDLLQVLANGGAATGLALASGLLPDFQQTARDTLQAGFTGALATATADTWATELGVLSSQPPRLLTTWKTVSPGTSGGITPLGTGATALGALSFGLVFWLLHWRPGETSQLRRQRRLPLIALLSGLAGSLFDSLLGATIQAMFYCPHCQKETERRVHNCGTPTRPLRGLPWMTNDTVNFCATLLGALVAIGLALLGKQQA
jgi:uncharacterized protein (TIGR00297 family)